MKKILQKTLQVLLLALFVFLIINGKVQVWMGLLLFGILASIFLGRFYCGWMCPINTVFKWITWAKKKLHIDRLKTPKFLKNKWVRILAFAIFAMVFAFIMIAKAKIPVLPALFLIGVLITLFFPEELWHRYLCPYGSMLRLSSSRTKHTMVVDEDTCNNCGICKKVCPGVAIEKEAKSHKILKGDCLVCMECVAACPQNSISYQ